MLTILLNYWNSDRVLSERSAGSSLRKAVNTGSSKRSSAYVISFINMSINGFIVEEWKTQFLQLKRQYNLTSFFHQQLYSSFQWAKLFQWYPQIVWNFSKNWIYVFFHFLKNHQSWINGSGNSSKIFFSLWSRRHNPLVIEKTSFRKVIWRTVVGWSSEDR